MRNYKRATAVLACVACVFAPLVTAQAATFTVTNAGGSGTGSLVQAIADANANPGADVIDFNIPGAGPHVITPIPVALGISETVVIDGYTQPGASANTLSAAGNGLNTVLRISVRGVFVTYGLDGIAQDVVIRGLAVGGLGNEDAIVLWGSGHRVEGCFIGTGVSGTTASPAYFGVVVNGDQCFIGGTTPAARNLISGNLLPGIWISGDNNYVYGNLIGTDITGTVALGNGQHPDFSAEGVVSEGNNNIVGGFAAGTRNVISASTGSGIFLLSGDGTQIAGNYIGTDVTGTADLGNGGWGIRIDEGDNTRVGLTSPFRAGNLISGNTLGGIFIGHSSGVTRVRIRGNTIGADASGQHPLPNGDEGVHVVGALGEIDVTIGGTSRGDGNTIAFNQGNGVTVLGAEVGIRRNAIHSNTGLGVDLGDDGVTINDLGDYDTGPNELMNFPEFAVVSCGDSIIVTGLLNSAPNSPYAIEFYSSPSCDPSSYGEGADFHGAIGVTTTGGIGMALFTVRLNPVPDGYFLTAMAIDANNNTSEFSQCVEVVNGTVVTNANDGGTGSLLQAMLNANACSGPDTISFNIPGPGPHTIPVTTALPVMVESVVIDGFTQPGSSPNTNSLTQGSNAVLKIQLDGTAYIPGASPGGSPFELSGGSSVMRGLAIYWFDSGPAFYLDLPGGHVVEGCYIGTDVTGTVARGNMFGVYVSSPGNWIGGNTPAARNVISGNRDYGIYIRANQTFVRGNFIGTTASGTAAVGNLLAGVYITGNNNEIGGPGAQDGNVISGTSSGPGVHLFGASINNIRGCYIGTNVAGTAALENDREGVILESGSSFNLIGHHQAARANVISGNFSEGVFIAESSNNWVVANLIGTNAAGTSALGNGGNGVEIVQSTGTDIGGPSAPYRNVISGNARNGIRIGASTSSTTVQSNYIGPSIAGNLPIGNGEAGVYIAGSQTLVGGAPDRANIIAYNLGYGGVEVVTNSGNTIRCNAMHSNLDLGIDLGRNGVTPNDAGDSDAGPNGYQNFPVITSSTGGISTEVVGTLNSTALTSFDLDFYYNQFCDGWGYGEGQVFMGSTTGVTGTNGVLPFNITLPTVAPGGSYITAAATAPDGSTSEFSACMEHINTETGGSVVVFPVDESNGSMPAEIMFDSVVTAGNTTVTTSYSGPPMGEGFILSDSSVYVDLTTDADTWGDVEICLYYDEASLPGPEPELALLHWVATPTPGAWEDITTYVDTTLNKACGIASGLSPFVIAAYDPASGISDIAFPSQFALYQNVPNPFNPATSIRYSLREASDVTLVVFDVAGRRVRTLVDAYMPAGIQDVAWDGLDRNGTHVASGVYFYRITAGAFTQTKKMVMLK